MYTQTTKQNENVMYMGVIKYDCVIYVIQDVIDTHKKMRIYFNGSS